MVAQLGLEGLGDIARDLEQDAKLHPLAYFRAWHSPRTSQRAVMQALQHNRTVIAYGGNRSGKTAGLRAVLVALVLGSDHPDAQRFWLLNGCDPDCFPTGPGQGWIVGLTNNASIQYHRRQIIDLLPVEGPTHRLSKQKRCWHGWKIDAPAEARIDIMVPGYSSPARIVFKTDDAGEDGAKGDSCRGILHDEEGLTPEFWDEAEKRLWDEDGWQMLANTPTRGKTWSYQRFVKARPPRTWSSRIHSEDNPHTEKQRLEELKQGDPDTVAMRTRGEHISPTGAVYKLWDPGRYVLDGLAALIPPDWPRYRAIDFGFRDPFCCLWLSYCRAPLRLHDGRVQADGSVLVYREHYRAEWTLGQHAQRIRELEGWARNPKAEGAPWLRDEHTERITLGWADTEAPGLITSLNAEYNLPTTGAFKAIVTGIELVNRLLHMDMLLIDGSCENIIREIPDYQWQDPDKKEMPIRTSDHALDPLRYGCWGVISMHRPASLVR